MLFLVFVCGVGRMMTVVVLLLLLVVPVNQIIFCTAVLCRMANEMVRIRVTTWEDNKWEDNNRRRMKFVYF